MKIDIDNCEAFFLDYYEGNLSKEGVEELFAFLTLHPDLREVFDSYDEVSFSPDKHISFEGKADLKKSEVMGAGINESNYEEYFVSEVEGLLSADEKIQLNQFIAQHPEKAEELEMLKQAILVPETDIVFENKSALKKSILVSEENFDEMAIASVEGLLNAEEEKVLAASIATSAVQQKSYALYQQTKLVADESIVFEDKEELKHKRGGFWWMTNMSYAAAAAVILFIGVVFWSRSGNDGNLKHDGNGIAKVDTSHAKRNPSIEPESKQEMASSNGNPSNDNSAVVKKVVKDQLGNSPLVPVKFVDEKSSFVALASNNSFKSLTHSVYPTVDFSDAYYDYTDYGMNSPRVQSESISMQQAAMRWMKKKLDHHPANQDENLVNTTMAINGNSSKDVTGFDITSSAVNRLSQATGANLSLGKEAEGTILTVGKYKVRVSHKR